MQIITSKCKNRLITSTRRHSKIDSSLSLLCSQALVQIHVDPPLLIINNYAYLNLLYVMDHGLEGVEESHTWGIGDIEGLSLVVG